MSLATSRGQYRQASDMNSNDDSEKRLSVHLAFGMQSDVSSSKVVGCEDIF